MNQLSTKTDSDTKNDRFNKLKPFIAVILIQFGMAGMDIISKVALNEGMSNYVFVVYRHAIAFIVMVPFAIIFDNKKRPSMTLPIFTKIVFLGLLEPVIDQNLYFLGLKHTTPTFAAAMCNILPAITFVMAWICGLENVNLKRFHSQAKIVGTLGTVAGAMIMTIVSGAVLPLPWTKQGTTHGPQTGALDLQHSIKGAIMITVGCFSWAMFVILQTTTLTTYPAELSLTAWICLMGTAESGILALVMERNNPSAWAIKWDTSLFAALYSGIICSGVAYYVQGIILKVRGPVFVTAFNPLAMVIVAIMSSFILGEQMFLGRLLGAVVIVAGLYLVVWGKSKDHVTQINDEEATLEKDLDTNSKDIFYLESVKNEKI